MENGQIQAFFAFFFGNVLKSLQQAYSSKKPDIYDQGDNDLVHPFCF
jgi:hypothetical protein